MTLPFTPRSSQARILQYTGGRLGISAVPGSGKTQTLSALAAQIVSSGRLASDQEVLVVTLVNSAVDNFSSRIADLIQSDNLIQRLGYRVRTLHGLAHDIVREDPALLGLDPGFSIMDEAGSLNMIHEAADTWVNDNPEFVQAYLSPEMDEQQQRRVASRDWPDYVETIAASFIRAAKDRHLSPYDVQAALDISSIALPLAEMGLEIYMEYENALAYRGAVDFDDLIRLAYQALDSSPELLERLQHRWPYILEDEAQDSSHIQQEIIARLVGPHGNWVRVGDPNQAIFETFTTADPDLLLDFIANNPSVDMPESGRSQQSIMDIANFLIDWTRNEHPVPEARDALNPPQMVPAPPGDAQPNPPDDPTGIHLVGTRYQPEQEISAVVESLQVWLPEHQDSTVAILTCTNDYAAAVAEALKVQGIEYRELLRSTTPTRAAAGALAYVLDYLASPESAPKLSQAYKVWRRSWRESLERRPLFDYVAALLRRQRNVEEYVAPFVPAGSADSLEEVLVADEEETEEVLAELAAFRDVVRRWHAATILPIDQLVLTVSQEIFTAPADLALAHKLALVLRQVNDENPEWRLPELVPTLNEIARNERRFIGFSEDDAGFNPEDYRGIVIVSTMHKAKGLEWDRVYLMSVNNHDYPSNQNTDRFISERWFVRDGLNLEAEALAQLDTAIGTNGASYREGEATRQARLDYVRERLRLFYVGITRARRELIITWNTGRRGRATPSVPFTALWHWWKQKHPAEQEAR